MDRAKERSLCLLVPYLVSSLYPTHFWCATPTHLATHSRLHLVKQGLLQPADVVAHSNPQAAPTVAKP